ncbi:hypothetical protein V6N11_016994 [Hibiscus sabdariffa]|uniref:Methyltransferase n=1 Tax=Hibiscus sabdariffa TaxID=183260 RepID=A0ABR2TWN8_9ROSI
MCPMRFLLVFFSAILAGYVAWRTVRSSPDTDGDVSEDAEKIVVKERQEFSFKRMVQNGFWVFVDMASGKYLWRNLKELKNDEKPLDVWKLELLTHAKMCHEKLTTSSQLLTMLSPSAVTSSIS